MVNPTRVQPPDVKSSQLLSLARMAMADSVAPDGQWRWPTLDFSDPEQRRFGDYELTAELGRGGMGVVYRARQLSLDREVAVKFIASGLSDTYQVARFIGEARAAARLVHPNIVPVYEVGTIDEIHYFSMPLIEGESLEQRLQQPLPMPDLLRLLLRICEAVDYAHRLGLLHLDLKPANVLIDARGEPLIADFGLARHVDGNGGVDAQEVSGTPAFMAPEQIMIKQYRLTAATDLYALGAMLYRCLTGASPHGDGGSDELIRRALAGRIRRVRELAPTVAPDLAAVCEKCLELEPRERYPSVRALIDDLRCIQAGLPVSVRRPGLIERAQRWLRREPKLAVAVAITFIAIAVGGLVALGQWREAEVARALAVRERDAATQARASEALQRQRAQDAAALGARLYAKGGEVKDVNAAAAEVVRWLQQYVPSDEARQAQILTDFAKAIDADGARLKVTELLYAVLESMAGRYREQIVQKLASRGDPASLVHAAMLSWRSEQTASKPMHVAEYLNRALQANPDDAFAWYVAATYCVGDGARACVRDDATTQLVRVDPDNGFAWALLASSQSGAAAYATLHAAALRPNFDDYFGASFQAYAKAIEDSGVPAPALVSGPALVLAPGERVEATVAQMEAWALPLPQFQRFVDLCHPGRDLPEDPAIRADCVSIGSRMASARSLIVNMIGSAVVRRLAPGTPLAQRMKDLRARYVYLMEQQDNLSPEQLLRYPLDRTLQDFTEVGELESFARKVGFYGLPTTPPADWVPRNPEALLLPEERKQK